MTLLDYVLGRRLANREQRQRKIGAFEGIPVMGLDGIGSSSYGPEAALAILIPLGTASVSFILWVMAPIIGLLSILYASYWQTIRAYPNNGGAYIVTKHNLGANASLLAAAALMIDYILNVAVGISAGVGALVSAIPPLHPYILPLCLGSLTIIVLANLRGTPEAGRLFALPTYVYIGSFLIILAIGLGNAVLSGGHPQAVTAAPPLPRPAQAVSFWLLLRAFASGCTAMTGVEAVSNGMTAFREPPVTYGHRTLSAIVVTLGLLLAGVAYLAAAYHIGAMDQSSNDYRSVLSQIAAAVVGHGVFYYVTIGSLLCVLTLSATTSFVDFPRLCRMVAEDGFLPRPFAIAGRRLVFSAGILYLGVTAGLMLVVFDGITNRLIPLFAIGAFLTFTLSQVGMVGHWRRSMTNSCGREKRLHRLHLGINIVGALATGVALIVIIVAKFTEGAWITVIIIPCVIALLKAVNAYYRRLAADVTDVGMLDLHDREPPFILVTIQEWDKLAAKALRLAMTLSPDVIAVHMTGLAGPEGEEFGQSLREEWRNKVEQPARECGLPSPRLTIFPASRRNMHEPLLKFAQELDQRFDNRRVVVLIPEVIKRRWYQYILHARRASRLRSMLLAHGSPRLTVMSVPWYVD